MGTNILQASKPVWFPRKRKFGPTRFYSANHPVQSKKGAIAYVATFLRRLWWSSVAVVAITVTGSILLEWFGYYGASNWLVNTTYSTSTLIMKMVGWK